MSASKLADPGDGRVWVTHTFSGARVSVDRLVSKTAAEVFRKVNWGVCIIERIADEMGEEMGYTEEEVRAGIAELYIAGCLIEPYFAVGGEAVSLYRGSD